MAAGHRRRATHTDNQVKAMPARTIEHGSGTAVPLMAMLSKRQLPDVLFKAVPCVLTLSTPVEAFTISIAKFGLFAAAGSLIVTVKPVNQSWPAGAPFNSKLSLT